MDPSVHRGDAPRRLPASTSGSATWTATAVRPRCASRACPASAAGGSRTPTDKDLALVMLQAYNDWHIDEWCGSHPGRFIPLAHRAGVGHGRDGRRGQADRGQGLPGHQHARAAARPGPAHLPERLLGPVLWQVCSDEGVVDVPAHRHGPRRHQTWGPTSTSTTSWCWPPRCRCSRAQDLSGARRCASTRAQVRVLRRRHRLDPVPHGPLRPPLREPAVDRPGLRRQAAERGVPRARPGLLHLRPDVAEARTTRSGSTSSPSRSTTRTPTRCGPTRPRSSSRSARAPGSPTTTSRRSPGATSPASATTTRSR